MRPAKTLKRHRPKWTSIRGNVFQFERRVPTDLRLSIVGKTLALPVGNEVYPLLVTPSTTHIRFSLRTRDEREAIQLVAEVNAYVDGFFARLRDGSPIELTHRQVMALAGHYYLAWSQDPDAYPPAMYVPDLDGILPDLPVVDYQRESERLLCVSGMLTDLLKAEGVQLRRRLFNKVAVGLLAEHGIIEVPVNTQERLVAALANILPVALETRARFAGGDFRPDETASRFPQWEPPAGRIVKAQQYRSTGKVSLTGLVETWWEGAKANGKSEATYDNYRKVFSLLNRFLRHDDALRVRPEDIEAYKSHRLTIISPGNKTNRPLALNSFRLGDWVALRSVFRWAAENTLIPESPMPSIRFTATRKVKLRDKNFTDAEASALLAASSNHLATLNRAPSRLDYAKRWVPWLCAYSGCRVGEALQLRKEDFRKAQGHLIMLITPEAGTVKTKEAREVPIHSHILEEGFEAFLKASADGHLFLDFSEEKGFRSNWLSRKNEVRKFVRKVVTDPNVPPNHGWRHTFKSKGFEVDIQEKVLDAICGHAPASSGRKYGHVSLKTKIDALNSFPRFTSEERTADAAE